MRRVADGPSHLPAQGTGAERELRTGAFVSFKVLGESGPGLYRVLVAGRERSLLSEVPLATGSFVRGRLQPAGAGSGATAAAPGADGADGLLRLVGAPAALEASAEPSAAGHAAPGAGPASRAAAELGRLGLPASPPFLAALGALLAAGLRPEAALMKRLVRLVDRPGLELEGREARARLELGARLESKGLAAEEESVGALLRSWAGEAGGEGGADGGTGRQDGDLAEVEQTIALDGDPAEGEGQSGAEGGGGESGDGASRRRLPVPPAAALLEEGELVSALAAGLRAIAESADAGSGFLGLQNQLRDASGAWVLVPFAFSLDRIDFRGSLRLRLPPLPGGPLRLVAGFEAGPAGRASTWELDLRLGEPGGDVLVLAPSSRYHTKVGLWADLAARLSALGLRLVAGDGERGAGGGLDIQA